jgi:hypothetical protein
VTVLTSDPDSGPEVLAQRVAAAVAAGADLLVLGRGVTHAVAPEVTAAAVADEVAAALARLGPRSTHPSGVEMPGGAGRAALG